MAKDVSNKTNPGNNYGDTLPSLLDSQKVPPLRIVLNTAAGNQKTPAPSSSTAPQQDNQTRTTIKNKQQEPKHQSDAVPVKGGRFRIKLGTNKQQPNKIINNSEISVNNTNPLENEEKQKNLASRAGLSAITSSKDESTSSSNKSSNYLRRITRRSQRSAQVITNEDEESISSMTSSDENQITQISNSDSNPAQELSSTALGQQSTTNSTSTNNAPTSTISSNLQGAETPRKYKKRRAENSESLTNEQLLFGLQDYSIPVQNSFKLFKNIRQQVDKKLDTLNTTYHPKAPHGFREYMLAKGAYLLDGNRLGNGANLTLNENGGMNIALLGKFNSRKPNKINYFVPDRANVPMDIPRDSPLRDLFVEQEKERYRMRMQHIKEREKLTLAAEQEIMRVYSQAAMAAVNQVEPLSVCTMLKHQEIYNYTDSNGVIVQANEENSQDEVSQDGVKTRRRQHEQITPQEARTTSNMDENQTIDIKTNNDLSGDSGTSDKPKEEIEKESIELEEESSASNEKEAISTESKKRSPTPEIEEEGHAANDKSAIKKLKIDSRRNSKSEAVKEQQKSSSDITNSVKSTKSAAIKDLDKELRDCSESKEDELTERKENKSNVEEDEMGEGNEDKMIEKNSNESICTVEETKDESNEYVEKKCHEKTSVKCSQQLEEKEDIVIEETVDNSPKETKESEVDPHSQCKEMFVVQLQEIDDKWERIRADMLIRHRNEAESLHAVQRLEWEWKTKEIGAIDVRATLVISDVLVPKLEIYPLDY